MKHKCEFCDTTTNRSRDDFCEIDWEGLQFGNSKMKCACPKHKHLLRDFMIETLERKAK